MWKKVRAATSKATVGFSVPEQKVPGGLVVLGASSSLQVTGESRGAAVLGVWAAHGLLKASKIHLDGHLLNHCVFHTVWQL